MKDNGGKKFARRDEDGIVSYLLACFSGIRFSPPRTGGPAQMLPKQTPKSKTTKPKSTTKRSATKLDLYAEHKNEYLASRLPSFVRVGPAHYLGITGRSKPGDEAFNTAVGALYNVAFTVKMARKFAGSDYTVTKLEGLWWLDNGLAQPTTATTWNWQLMIRVPPFITSKEVQEAIDQLIAREKPADVRRVQLVELREDTCVQILHVGPYTEERESIEKMRAFAQQAGRSFTGKHHEIYLSDPRRVKPEKLKTILRQPVT
jgi:hypothetical protein